MYLLVVVTLVIGLIGIYAEVLMVQAAQIASRQTTLAQMMMTWHSAAVSMGASIYDTNPNVVMPCSLTETMAAGTYAVAWPPAGLSLCAPPWNAVIPKGSGPVAPENGTVTTGNAPNTVLNYKTGQPELVHLPSSYAANLYQFYSVLYMDTASNQPYVVTFMQPPVISALNPPPGYLTFPPNASTLTSFTMSDLMHQLQVSGLQPYTFGSVADTVSGIHAVSTLTTSTFQYTLPVIGTLPAATTAILDNGAGGIVTSIIGY